MTKRSVPRSKAKPSRSSPTDIVTFAQQRRAIEKFRKHSGVINIPPPNRLVGATPGETVINSIRMLEVLKGCIKAGETAERQLLLLDTAIDGLFFAENSLHYLGQEAGVLIKRRAQEARS